MAGHHLIDTDRVWELLVSTLGSVGVVFVMASVGIWLTRTGVITTEAKKQLSAISMKVTIPALLFTRMLWCKQCGVDRTPLEEVPGCDRCEPLRATLGQSWVLLFIPCLVVGFGVALGSVIVRHMDCPEDFRRGAVAAVAFGNSTGLPIILLSVIYSGVQAKHPDLLEDPMKFLPSYLILYPMLQWSIGSWLFGVGEDEPKPKLPPPTEQPRSSSLGGIELQPSTPAAAPTAVAAAAPEQRASAEGPRITRVQSEKYCDCGNVFKADSVFCRVCGAERPGGPEVPPLTLRPDLTPRKPLFGRPCRQMMGQLLQPPVLATLAGLFLGLMPLPFGGPGYPTLRALLVDLDDQTGDAPLQWIYRALYKLGDAAVPINVLILGASLASGGAFKELPLKVNFAIVAAKMIVLPTIMFVIVSVLRQFLLTGYTDRVRNTIWFVALTVSCTPTANNIQVLATLGRQNANALSTTIFLQYICSPVLVTLWLVIFLATMPHPPEGPPPQSAAANATAMVATAAVSANGAGLDFLARAVAG